MISGDKNAGNSFDNILSGLNNSNSSSGMNSLNFKLKFDYDLESTNSFGHRSGWKNVLKELYKINNNDSPKEILLLDFIEKTFSWDYIDKKNNPYKEIIFNGKKTNIPIDHVKIDNEKNQVARFGHNIIKWNVDKWEKYDISFNEYNKLQSICSQSRVINEPWIGIWHNPHEMPSWFDYHNSPQTIIKKDIYLKSIKSCKGIIVLSTHFAKWVKKIIPTHIPVSVLYHPTDQNVVKFSFDKFIENDEKCIIQIGYWLRKMCAIGQLNTSTFTKIWLHGSPYAFSCLKTENKIHRGGRRERCSNMENVIKMRVDDESYDHLLSENICFLYLYDSSANNAIIECIARNTPLLVNKHPAVVEYLGEDYPFYYNTIEEAEKKMHNFELINDTHKFMESNIESHSKISYERFINDFKKCEVVKNCD
jgi:hypothetical protein